MTDTNQKPAADAKGTKAGNSLKPLDEVRSTLMSPTMAQQLKMALPAHITVEKFQRVAVTAIIQRPELLEADRGTLYAECIKCAQDGLVPDGREATLTVFNERNGDKWRKVAKYMPMVWGIVKKVRNSGELLDIGAHVVYDNDKFDYFIDDTGEHLQHRPLLDGDRGGFRLVYAIAKTKDGGRYVEVMTKQQVDQVMGVSKSKDKNGNPVGPWKEWYPEQARKTVIRRLAKRLPLSTDKEDELRRVIERDDELYDLNRKDLDKGPAEVVPVDGQRPRRLQAVVDARPQTSAPAPAAEPATAEQPPAGHPATDTPPATDAGGEVI